MTVTGFTNTPYKGLLSICLNNPARTLYLSENSCVHVRLVQISQCINIIHWSGGFVGKFREKGLIHIQNSRCGWPVLTNGKRPKAGLLGHVAFATHAD